MRGQNHRTKEQFMLLERTDVRVDKLAIFIHGFRGNYVTTWGNLTHLLRWEADKDKDFREWDYLFIGYNTSTVSTYLDIANLIWTQWKRASKGAPPYKHPYKKLALFGHSLGTLGLRQVLCSTTRQPPGMQNALHSVTFFGSPINGSPWAPVGRIFYKIAGALSPGNPQLRMLKDSTESAHRVWKWPEVQLVLGMDDKVVGYANGELFSWAGDGDPPDYRKLDHSALVKPDGWNSSVIDYIRGGLL